MIKIVLNSYLSFYHIFCMFMYMKKLENMIRYRKPRSASCCISLMPDETIVDTFEKSSLVVKPACTICLYEIRRGYRGMGVGDARPYFLTNFDFLKMYNSCVRRAWPNFFTIAPPPPDSPTTLYENSWIRPS